MELTTKRSRQEGNIACGPRSPGPKYELRTLVGFRGHCLSKYRGPAYSFGGKCPTKLLCPGPGPKYLLAPPKRVGYTFGVLGKKFDTAVGPGPKYALPSPKGVAFTLKSRTNPRRGPLSPGPCHNTRLRIPGPAFYIGERLRSLSCSATPAPIAYKEDLVKLRAPEYTLGYKVPHKEICSSPGPKYNLKLPKSNPKYSFGIRHSDCAPPYVVQCDDKC